MTEQEIVEEKSKYTRKIEIPIYEPKNRMPNVHELLDTEKRDELIQTINKTQNIPDEVREFLITAAYRHTQFNYSLIADFYAHAPLEIKDLMEQSALVIIDYDKAIENGFISYEKEIKGIMDEFLDSKDWE